MTTRTIRGDELGLFVWVNGRKHRPGDVPGYSHAHYMEQGNLKVGDKAKVQDFNQSPLVRIHFPEPFTGKAGIPTFTHTFWHAHDTSIHGTDVSLKPL